MEPAAGVAILHQVRQHGAARVVVSHRGTNLEPDLQPQLVDALRQLHALVVNADQPFGPSKADSIAAMKRAIAGLPAEVRALVVPS
jgi:aminoglycoside phosphotransferase